MDGNVLATVASRAGELAWRVARILWRVAAYGLAILVLLLTLAVASCRSWSEYDVTPSPGRTASLLVDHKHGAFGGDAGLEVSLSGARFADRVTLGYIENTLGLGWLDDATVNVCALWRDERLPLSIPLVGEDGVRRVYKVVAQCTPAMAPPQPKLQPSVEGFDFPTAATESR
jgi:hypothetical protein